jgi:hypothetical protein
MEMLVGAAERVHAGDNDSQDMASNVYERMEGTG